MKNKLVKTILGLLTFIFVLTGCSKNEDAISTLENTKQSILTFKTTDEFNETLSKVNAMSKTERLAWEKEQGFKSFGTICDEFYETIDPKIFKNIDEVKSFVAKNSDKIQLYSSSDGETYCVTVDFRNSERYLINKNKECKIGSIIYKNSGNDLINQNSVNSDLKSQKVSASFVTSDEIIDQDTIGNDTYRMHIWINTYNYFDADLNTYLKNELKLSNFARWAAIWWERTYSTEYRITLKTTDITYGLLTAGNGSNTITENIKTKYILNSYKNLPIGGGNLNSSPSLVYYNIYAKNKEKGCTINQTKTY